MKDLDFDELDRAVNSLMTGVSKTPEPKKADDHEQTLTITPTIKDDTAPSFSTLDKTVSQINTPTGMPNPTPPIRPAQRPTPASPPAARRGRFMDMVRSQPVAKPVDSLRPTSRQGVTIEPAGVTSMSDITPPSPMVKERSAPAPAPVAPAPTSEWPDPIEMTTKADSTKLLDTPEPEELLEATNPPAKPPAREDYTPLATPFLTDTKVEKRPLGGAMSDASAEDASLKEAEEAVVAADTSAQLPADPTDIAPLELPEELSGDLVAIESGARASLPPEATDAPEEHEEMPQPAILPREEEEKPAAAKSAPTEKPLPTGPISIPQQYREEPSTGDKQSGSIYDTDTYHQPLSHPAKKKSGWLWVVWTVVLLLVGAGAAAAFYYLDLV